MHLQTLTAVLSLGATLTSARVLPANERPTTLMNHSLTSLSGRSPPSPTPSHLTKRQFGPTPCTNNCFFNVCQARCGSNTQTIEDGLCGSNPQTIEDGLCILTCQTQCTLECAIWDPNSKQADFTPPKDPKQPQFKGQDNAIMEMEIPADMVHADAEDIKTEVMDFVEQWAGEQQQQQHQTKERQ